MLQATVFSQWREGHEAHNEARAAKLLEFFGAREDWWRLPTPTPTPSPSLSPSPSPSPNPNPSPNLVQGGEQ